MAIVYIFVSVFQVEFKTPPRA